VILDSNGLTTMKYGQRPRILIAHQGCVPIYRKALYEHLATIPDIDYVVLHGNPPHGSNLIPAPEPYRFAHVRIKNTEWSLFGMQIIYQPIVSQVLAGKFDGFVLGDELKFVSSVMIMLLAKLRGWPVVLWGFGYHPDVSVTGSARPLGRFLTRVAGFLKIPIYRLVDGYLVYTESGVTHLIDNGMGRDSIAVLYNTVDVETQQSLRRKIEVEPLADNFRVFGFDGSFPILLYFGRFLPAKRINLLIDYIRHAANDGRRIGLLIFGGGVEKERLVKSAVGLDTVRFFAHDDLALTRALRIASAVVIPGFVGLAITHAFAHGKPVITRAGQMHSPEIDYLKHGENGLLLPRDRDAFFNGLDSYLDDRELQERLHAGAAAAAEQFKIANMAVAFDDLVRRILTARRLLSPTRVTG
jgi:glycosyltransferase involved in cell wall biosynthesis